MTDLYLYSLIQISTVPSPSRAGKRFSFEHSNFSPCEHPYAKEQFAKILYNGSDFQIPRNANAVFFSYGKRPYLMSVNSVYI